MDVVSVPRRAARFVFAVLLIFFDHKRGLPEEQVRRDRRTEHADHRREPARVEVNAWDREVEQHLSPRRPHDESGDDVGKERQRQPLENARDGRIREARLRGDQADAEEKDERVDRNRHDQLRGGGHAADVGSEIERVGHDHESG